METEMKKSMQLNEVGKLARVGNLCMNLKGQKEWSNGVL